MAESQPQDLLPDEGLQLAWARQPSWRILDTEFAQGLRFLRTWQAWLADPHRPRLLHYVALTPQTPATGSLLQAAAPYPELLSLAQELAPLCGVLSPGFHRLNLNQGRVLLTLCVGETRALLREQHFAADAVVLDASVAPGEWDRWTCKALARCCRRGTRLTLIPPSHEPITTWLTQCGFAPQGAPRSNQWQFNPPWELKTTRQPQPLHAPVPATCAVIGSGLAGASVAAALARRGWQVQVLEAGATPAAGASGLPVGLMVPHVSVDDSPRSRLSRSGIRLTLQQTRHLLRAEQDWAQSGVLEHREIGVSTLWHALAGWIKPARLVQAWLAQPGITFAPNAPVAALRREGDVWLLLDTQGQPLARASHVVLANACAATQLLESLQNTMPTLRSRLTHLPTLQGVRGVLSWGVQPPGDAAALPPYPINGWGGLIPNVPLDGADGGECADGEAHAGTKAWYLGATYEADASEPAPLATHHQTNLDKLRTLLPAAAQALDPAFAAGRVQAWQGKRCVSPDRLPVVGPLDAGESPSLWISVGMGSRGLSFAVLCAELLAARLGGEPLPVEASLARQLEALRAGPPS